MKAKSDELEFEFDFAETPDGRFGYKIFVNSTETIIFPFLLGDTKVHWKTENGSYSPIIQAFGEAIEEYFM